MLLLFLFPVMLKMDGNVLSKIFLWKDQLVIIKNYKSAQGLT